MRYRRFYAHDGERSRDYRRVTPLLRAARPLIDRDDVIRWDVTIGANVTNFYNFEQAYRSVRYWLENPVFEYENRFVLDVYMYGSEMKYLDRVRFVVVPRVWYSS